MSEMLERWGLIQEVMESLSSKKDNFKDVVSKVKNTSFLLFSQFFIEMKFLRIFSKFCNSHFFLKKMKFFKEKDLLREGAFILKLLSGWQLSDYLFYKQLKKKVK